MLAVAQDGSWSVYSSLCHVMHCKGRLEDVERFDWAMPALIAAYPDLLGKEAQLVGGTLQRALDGSSMVTAAEVLKPVTAGYLSLQATRWDTCAFLNLHAAVRMLWESNSSDLHAYRIQLVRAFFTHLSENWTTFVTHRSGYLFEMPTFAADFVLALKLDSFEVTSAFVECWNRNVQNLPTFEYPEDLQAALKRLLEQGHTLQLPGWPEVSILNPIISETDADFASTRTRLSQATSPRPSRNLQVCVNHKQPWKIPSKLCPRPLTRILLSGRMHTSRRRTALSSMRPKQHCQIRNRAAYPWQKAILR